MRLRNLVWGVVVTIALLAAGMDMLSWRFWLVFVVASIASSVCEGLASKEATDSVSVGSQERKEAK